MAVDLLTVFLFWLLCIIGGVGFALAKYAYLEFLEFLYQDVPLTTLVISTRLRRLLKFTKRLKARMRHGKYMQERLPVLREATRANGSDSTWAIAERLKHVKHIRNFRGDMEDLEDVACG